MTFGPARAARSVVASLREALANDGIRRLEVAWSLGVAADTGLLVILLIAVYQRDGALATGLLGAFRMVPAVVVATLSGSILGRVRGDRLLVIVGVVRAVAAVLCAVVIAMHGHVALLYVLGAVVAAAGAPVRPTQITLMPAFARSPSELVAANMAWSTGEGLGATVGPLVIGVLVGAGLSAEAALLAAAGFLVTGIVVARLRFEHVGDAMAGGSSGRALRGITDGFLAARRRPVIRWAYVTIFGQVLTRGLLASFIVVASIELLAMGEQGVGVLNGAFGLGGLVGAVFAVSIARTGQLVRTLCAALAWWGAPIAVIALLPYPPVALIALGVIGLANATYDIAVFTILQRGSTNEDRAAVLAVNEGVAGLGAVTGSLLAPLLLGLFGVKGALAVGGAFLPILALLAYGRLIKARGVSIVDESTVAMLRHVPAFAELPLTAIERLAAGLVPTSFAAGATVMRQGEPGDRFVVVESGRIEVLVDDRPVQHLGPGDGVGEIALLRRSPRTATVIAMTDVSGFSIDCDTFFAAIAGPAAAATAERMADTNLRRAGAGMAATLPGAASGGG